jgi:anti-anti-sigma factor
MSGLVTMPDGNAALAGQPAAGRPSSRRASRAETAQRWELSADDRGDVAVVSLRGELDLLGASVLRACLSGIRWRALSVADLAELAFIDCVCLGVLVRHCQQVRGTGGSFSLAGPQPAVRWVLSATGLLTWFDVHDTCTEAVAGARRSPGVAAACARPRAQAVAAAPGAFQR